MLAARGWAVIRGRDYVVPEDVKAVARAVLGHRVTVRPELWMTAASGPRIVDSVLAAWAKDETPMQTYAAGTQGPEGWPV